jgi:RimJ/RimL family protein N-acetyltransferase
MRVVEATWEKRNLGLVVAEVTLDGDLTSLPAELDDVRARHDYVLVRVPARRVGVLHRLEDLGFRFIEAQFELLADLVRPKPCADAIAAITARTRFEPVSDAADLESLLGKLDEATFANDRVALDPLLGPKLSLQRCRNWIRDEFPKEGNVLAKLIYGDREAGFFLLRQAEPAHYFSTLAGVFTPYRNSGIGLAAIRLPLVWAQQHGAKRVTTRNSSNNLESFRAHLAAGYEVQGISYLLRHAAGIG